jgi:phosphoribosylanthranilate isomerase
MSNLKIKVCGMRDAENIRQLAALKPDLMGFVFYPASPRYAGEIPAEGLLKSIPAGIVKTGVFVNADLYSIKAQVLRFELSAVQLHGNESPEICKQLTDAGLKVIKAFRINENTDFSKLMTFVCCCKWFLFDTATGIPGGSGKSFNWKLLEKYELGHPFFLSGGIGPGDAEKILSLKHPALAGVDINSRFEAEAGIKNIAMVKRFIFSIRNKNG